MLAENLKEKKQVNFNSFTTLSVIGRGAYAKVILAKKHGDDPNKVYALKIMKKKYIEIKKQMDHVITEKNILIGMNHPFIIKLYYAFQDEKKLYLALDYCPGGELFGLLSRRKRFSEEQAKFYAAQMILALEHLHGKDIVYRDLKPENVLIDSDGYLKLTDFGLSKINMKNSSALSLVGTPEYLAPEILFKKGHGKPVDWWCLGSLLYEMVIGLPPFYSKNRSEVFDKIKYTQPIIPNFVSKKLKDLLQKLFRKQPDFRLGANDGSMQIKSHPWFEGFDWKSLLQKTMKAPFVPQIQSKIDTSYIDPTFTKEDLSSHNASPRSDDDKKYQEFQYNKSNDQKNNLQEGEQVTEDIDIEMHIEESEEKSTKFMIEESLEEKIVEETNIIEVKLIQEEGILEEENVIKDNGFDEIEMQRSEKIEVE